MPEHVARTHTQRALHSLILDDNESARMYLLRALSSLSHGVIVPDHRSHVSKFAKG
jgi:hypothetical protein